MITSKQAKYKIELNWAYNYPEKYVIVVYFNKRQHLYLIPYLRK